MSNLKPVYKVAPTFTATEEDFQSYREEIWGKMKVARMLLMSYGNTILWCDEQIERFKPKEKKANPPKDLNTTK